jgi:hypothetical protein
MKNPKKLLLSFFIIIIISSIFLLAGCVKAPKRSFATQELLFDPKVMPETWKLIELENKNPINEGQEDGSYITFQKSDTVFFARAGEDIYRYYNNEKAKQQYKRFIGLYLEKQARDLSDWQAPNNFHFISALTDNWKFACANHEEILNLDKSGTSVICRYIAQYEEFLVSFTIRKDADGQELIEMDNIERIIEAIDQQMINHLR